MSVDYASIAAEVAAAMDEVSQGHVVLKRVTVGTPPNDWTEGEKTVETWPLKATVRTVSQKYIDGTLIIAGDRQVTFAVPATVPLMSDLLAIDGADHVMKDLRAVPGAGTPVMYVAFIAN